MSENKGYVHPEVLVDIDWVETHLHDPSIRLIEVDVATTVHAQGHIPGAATIPWPLAVRDDWTIKPADELRSLYASKGVTKDKEVVAYCRIREARLIAGKQDEVLVRALKIQLEQAIGEVPV